MTQIKTQKQLEIEYQNTYFEYHFQGPEKAIFTNAKNCNKVNVYRGITWVAVGCLCACVAGLIYALFIRH
jgi:hypothetical protein